MKPVSFSYVAARSLEEALAALADGGEDAKPLAGGQSLVPALNMRLVRPTLLVDLARAGLGGIERANGTVRVGATTRQVELQRSEHCPQLAAEALPHVGHAATRNRGTVGGSVAHADAAAELPVCLAALGGSVVTDRRQLPAAEFFTGPYTTALEPGELVTATLWPTAAGPCAFEELALRRGDFALSMVAVSGTRVAVGAVTDRPTVLHEVGALLAAGEPGDELAAEAGALAASLVDPAGHLHASPAYLKHVTGVLVERALRRAWTSG
ncbi:MAG TPA: FAD binding domain-containing protein [Gaiellaceae bacterium]|nr:FAD binding domain-containing protein [Gaiellaceae bacterium]